MQRTKKMSVMEVPSNRIIDPSIHLIGQVNSKMSLSRLVPSYLDVLH